MRIEALQSLRRERELVEKSRAFREREAQIGCTQLVEISIGAPARQGERRLVARQQYDMQGLWQVREQEGQCFVDSVLNNDMVIFQNEQAGDILESGFTKPGFIDSGWLNRALVSLTPDGRADLLFQNTSGPMMLCEMNGTSIAAQVDLPNPGPWQSVNGHPFAA